MSIEIFRPTPAVLVARRGRAALPGIARAARRIAVAGAAGALPKALIEHRDRLRQSLVEASRRQGRRLDAEIAACAAGRPEQAEAVCADAVAGFVGKAGELLAGFPERLASAHAAVVRADRALRRGAAEIGFPLAPVPPADGVVMLAALVLLGALEAMLGAMVIADYAPSMMHAWLVGAAVAALVVGSGIGLGFAVGRQLRRQEAWRRLLGAAGCLVHMALVGVAALCLITVRELAVVQFGDLEPALRAAPAAVARAIATGEVSPLLQDLRGLFLLVVTVGFAGPLAFWKGVTLGDVPGAAPLRRALAAAEDARAEVIEATADGIDDLADDARDAIHGSVADHAAQAEAADSLLNAARADARALRHGDDAARAALAQAATAYAEALAETLGPLTPAPAVTAPALGLDAEHAAAAARVETAARLAATAEADAADARAAAAAAHLALRAAHRAARGRFDAILRTHAPEPPPATPAPAPMRLPAPTPAG